MPRCLLPARFCSRRTRNDEGADGAGEADEFNEKRGRSPRDWAAVFLTALRFLQFTYFALVYFSLRSFQRSSFFHEDGPWQRSPDQVHHSSRMLRWIRMQAAITLIYQTVVLVVPWLRRLMGSTRRPFTGLGTVFLDGCVAVAMLNTMVMLDTDHESYCHRFPQIGNFDLRSMLNLSPKNHRHDMSSHRSVCNSLDVIFGLGGLIILSHVVTAAVTARRAKQSAPTVFAKVEPASDVEQGIVAQRPVQSEAGTPATPQRQHSPPPPYRSGVSEFAQGDSRYAGHTEITPVSRGRTSIETTSSLGIENYLVSDGWRAPEQPPEYSSRPPSLRNGFP